MFSDLRTPKRSRRGHFDIQKSLAQAKSFSFNTLMSYSLFEVKEKLGSKTARLAKELISMRKVHERMVPEVDLEGFGMSMRKLREDADISGRDMAKRLGVSAAFLSDCELGRRKLSSPLCILFIHYCQSK